MTIFGALVSFKSCKRATTWDLRLRLTRENRSFLALFSHQTRIWKQNLNEIRRKSQVPYLGLPPKTKKQQPEVQFWGPVIGAWNRYATQDPETARFQDLFRSESVKNKNKAILIDKFLIKKNISQHIHGNVWESIIILNSYSPLQLNSESTIWRKQPAPPRLLLKRFWPVVIF